MKDNKYYLGLDIGTASVGWCCTDLDYNVLKIKNKRTIGTRLFPGGETAAVRREYRGNRRRLDRRKYRLNILEELFFEEINKVDTSFFQRLKESKYWLDDKTVKEKNILFNDNNYKDKDFYKTYPTIYHLRVDLFSKENPDIREIYLACHHILKYRGHFIFEGDSFSNGGSILEILTNLRDEILLSPAALLLLEEDDNLEKIEKILLNKNKTREDRARDIDYLLNKNKQLSAFFKLSLGLTTKLDAIFEDSIYKEESINKISFSTKIYEEVRTEYEVILKDDIVLIDYAKLIYDSLILNMIKEPGKTISQSKVSSYDKHKEDLKVLKKAIKQDNSLSEEEKISIYNKLFKANEKNNYVCYIGKNALSKGGTGENKKSSYTEFKKYLDDNVLKKLSSSEKIDKIKKDLELDNFLTIQRTRDNGTIPYQLHLEELKLILKNAEKYYPSFLEKTDGHSVSEKIIKLLEFRIPYYIGPLNNYHSGKGGNAWVVKHNNDKITPWNFNQVVDEDASAEKFIRKMTNKCTYLMGEDVIPKYSLLYSEYTLLNELNNISIDNVKIPLEVRNFIIDEFFKNSFRKVTKKNIEEYLRSINLLDKDKEISGIDEQVGANLKSYVEIKNILGNKFEATMVEDIIFWITIFGETKKLVIKKIEDNYGNILTKDEIRKLSKLRYTGWGNFSKKLLTETYSKKVYDTSTGELFSIINFMRNNMLNFMEVMSSHYGYMDAIEVYNKEKIGKITSLDYSMLDGLYISPSVKKSVWQTLKIVDEIKTLLGKEPEKIFLETTRSNKHEKKRTKSRKSQLDELFKNLKNDRKILEAVSDHYSDDIFKTKKVWLYCTQLGRCMYSNEEISISELFDNNICDIDHIYPQSKVKDDSLHRNLVLTLKKYNAQKDNKYPLTEAFGHIRDDVKIHWKMLLDKKLITKEKYDRLINKEAFSPEQLSKFISRQLVETSQSTKVAASLLKNIFPNSEVCYVKAENVSDFRREFSYKTVNGKNNKPILETRYPELMKIRELNHYHHAHDAYLNIIVGNVYHTMFTRNPLEFIKSKNSDYSLKHIYSKNVKNKNCVAWEVDKTIHTILKELNSKRVLVVNKPEIQKGALYDATIYNKNQVKEDSYIGVKTKDEKLSNVTKYGGFGKIKISYYSIISYDIFNKDKLDKKIEILPIPVYMKNHIKNDNDIINYFISHDIKKEISNKIDNIKVVYRKLCIGSLVKIDGYYYYIGGKTNNNLCIDGAVEILIDKAFIPTLKLISNFAYKYKEDSKEKVSNKINLEDNLALFDHLVEKMNQGILLNKKSNKYNKFIEPVVREKFSKLSLEKQAIHLLEILNILNDNKKTFELLKNIGITHSRNTIGLSLSNVRNLREFKVIEHSSTGLYEKVVTII